MFNLIGEEKGRFLDVGCGPAVYTLELLERGFEVWAVDLSPEMILQAKERVAGLPFSEKAHFSVGDLLSLDSPNEFFDILLCIGVLSYVPDIRKALWQIQRLLRPGGIAILQASNPLSPFEIFEIRSARPIYRWTRQLLTGEYPEDYYVKLTPYSTFHLKKMCENLGLEKISLHYYDFRLPILYKFFPKTTFKISKKLEIFERSCLLGLLGASYLLKVQKVLDKKGDP